MIYPTINPDHDHDSDSGTERFQQTTEEKLRKNSLTLKCNFRVYLSLKNAQRNLRGAIKKQTGK